MRRDDGASAVEYGLLIAAVGAVLLATTIAFGGIVRDTLFTTGCTALQAASPGAEGTENCPTTP
ncbi:Flp family type IVb pilin [Aquipuribacter nitratireducens]|uniref:Flp family type IVb pilin n=1 Tax=Aquipuribacter nitratireducens TaxID=650104 RepID=A0ABW0GRD1_9MICO